MKMSDKEVKDMLQKYMDGMTSVEEEARLTAYFRKAGDKAAPEGMASEDWQAYKEMFAMFAPRRRKAGVIGLWRWAAAAAVLAVVIVGGSLWRGEPAASGGYVAMAEATDSTATEAVADTMAIEVAPQRKQPAMKQPVVKPKRVRHEPAVPRHYMAQAAPSTEVDPEEALKQADLLMQAVYLQQQNDLNSAIMQCTLVIEEEEENY